MLHRRHAVAETAAIAVSDGIAAMNAVGRAGTKAVSLATSQKSLALLDQAVVSGASFIVTVMIGRYADAGELGIYALAGSVLIWLTNAQESLVAVPYTIRRHRSAGPVDENAGYALALNGMLATLAIFTIGMVSLSLFATGGRIDIVAVVLTLAVIAPFVIHREFARRMAFAEMRVGEALVLDCVIAAMQIGILGWLAWTGQLSSIAALAALGFACAVSGLVWLCLFRRRFQLRRKGLGEAMGESWHMGKWLFANQLFGAIQSQVTYWILAVAAGVVATGIYIACMSIALIVNPIIIGLSNILWAKAARALRDGGSGRLLRESINDAIVLGLVIAVFCFGIVAIGDAVLRLLYPGADYAGYGNVVTILAFVQLAYAIGMPATIALSGLGWLRTNSLIAAVETVLTIILAWPLVTRWGVQGAAYGILIGAILRCVVRWTVLIVVVRKTEAESKDGCADSDAGDSAEAPSGGRVISLYDHFVSRARFQRDRSFNP